MISAEYTINGDNGLPSDGGVKARPGKRQAVEDDLLIEVLAAMVRSSLTKRGGDRQSLERLVVTSDASRGRQAHPSHT